MQKKLLLLTILTCISLHTMETEKNEEPVLEKKTSLSDEALAKFQKVWEETQGTPEENLRKYKKRINRRFKQNALVLALTHNPQAINEQYEENEKENKVDEEKTLKLIDDTDHSRWSTPATTKSMVGFLKKNEQDFTAAKNKENQSLKDKFIEHQNKFDEIIRPELISKLQDKRYMLFNHFLAGLKKCGNDKECLTYNDVVWDNITKPEFLNKYCDMIYSETHQKIVDLKIPLTLDQLIVIAATIKSPNETSNDFTNKTLVEQIEIGKNQIREEIDFIQHPEKRIKAESLASPNDNNDKDSIEPNESKE